MLNILFSTFQHQGQSLCLHFQLQQTADLGLYTKIQEFSAAEKIGNQQNVLQIIPESFLLVYEIIFYADTRCTIRFETYIEWC